MVSCCEPLRSRFRLISMLPVCIIVLLAASTPTSELSDSTSGSSMMARAASCCSRAMRSKDTDSAASTRARSWPVSCTGNSPFGISTYSSTVSASVASATSSVSGCRSSTHCSAISYCPISRSNRRWMRAPMPCWPGGVVECQRADIIGTSVSDTTAEIRMVMASVTANSRNSRPTTSPMNSKGISTATSDTVSEMMVKPICVAPLSAACIGFSPFSM